MYGNMTMVVAVQVAVKLQTHPGACAWKHVPHVVAVQAAVHVVVQPRHRLLGGLRMGTDFGEEKPGSKHHAGLELGEKTL